MFKLNISQTEKSLKMYITNNECIAILNRQRISESLVMMKMSTTVKQQLRHLNLTPHGMCSPQALDHKALHRPGHLGHLSYV